MDSSLGPDKIPVDELDVYTTSIRESFMNDLMEEMRNTIDRGTRWMVFFSHAAACKVLDIAGVIDDETGKAEPRIITSPGQTLYATIGPTTRDYLKEAVDFEPEVSAKNPTPEEIEKGIRDFLAYRKKFLLDSIADEW
ncbi:Bgt-4392-2 [Blumeria graminis f. sp. tritici]|uniref:Bgt-4392-2 n=4 Tax=Blumeria graminis TaxID=34373 RepID=A0A9X9MHZ3_BLUGR|nr:hypothetical protein BGT96224_4392B [Blumeria graminis f. sp. tritici 96224]VDB88873.1 Bgt-4392-2 [Blumeria graminis f. sp. tritici]